MRANKFISGLIKFLLKYSISKRLRPLCAKTQIGQGLIEYLLILVLTVTILSAVAKGVGVPVVDYMKNKVFDMVGCMIRVGERYDIAFDICGGVAALSLDLTELTEGQNQTGSNSGSGPSQSTSSNNRTNSNNGGGGGSGGSCSGFRNSNSTGSVDGNGSNSGSGSEIAGAKNRIKIDNEDSGSSNFSSDNGASEPTVLIRRIKVGKQIRDKITLSTKNNDSSGGQVINSSTKSKKIEDKEEKGRRRISSFSVEKQKKDLGPDSGSLEDESFSFIKIAKWFLIIAIVLIIGVFTLGQLNSIRKGWTD